MFKLQLDYLISITLDDRTNNDLRDLITVYYFINYYCVLTCLIRKMNKDYRIAVCTSNSIRVKQNYCEKY